MLRWSFQIARIAGIRLSVHLTFLLLLASVAWEAWIDAGWLAAVSETLLVLVFFFCVLLHELGHCFTAKAHGIEVPRILLMPIGGMAEFEGFPRSSRLELLIALAGPAVNVVLVLGLLPFLDLQGLLENEALWSGLHGFLTRVAIANAGMACFNLLPVFPMDGGRVLRALLATKLSYLRATFWAAATGKTIAICGIAIALWQEFWLLGLLLGFVVYAAENEYRQVKKTEDEAHDWASLSEQRNPKREM